MRIGAIAVVAAAAALLAAGCGTVGRVAANNDVGLGKTLFQQDCAACHTLADAKATGTVGPNLDHAFGGVKKQGFELSTIRDVIRGQIAYPSAPMPVDLVKGKQADDVAAYVAQVAGEPVQGSGVKASPLPGQAQQEATTTPKSSGAGAAGGAGSAQGKSIFASAGCAGCHTLKAAGATGTVGPNLDQLKPSKDVVAHQVENGGGIMPAFKGRLSPQQIAAVAEFVSSSAGK